MLNLNESLYMMAGAFDLFPDAIIVVDKKGCIRNANKQVETLFGFSLEEIKNQELNILLPDHIKKHHAHLMDSFFGAASIRKMGSGVSLLGKHKSGKEISIDIALSLIDTGSEKFALAVIRDISDKMNLVNQINHIEKIKNELEQFDYVLTHDLKAPLNRVKMLTHLINLELSEKESQEINTIISYLNESVMGMERLIYGVLDFHKAKLDKNQTNTEIDLNDVYKEVCTLVTIPNNFTLRIIKPFPKVIGNNALWLQIFLNLIDNAITHTKKKQGILEIDWSEDEAHYQFSFADNGIAIPKEQYEHIFDLNTQLDGTKFLKHHGIGLSIVKQAIEHQAENKIWYEESTLGGSCFKFIWSK